MMALDSFNTLDTPPNKMRSFDTFIKMLHDSTTIEDVYLTGTNTDPCLYRYHQELTTEIRKTGKRIGIRTNGTAHVSELRHYDNGSVTVCSPYYHINLKMMGGPPPDFGELSLHADLTKWNINTVLGPENANKTSIEGLIDIGLKYGLAWINLREPYGQAHIGDMFLWATFGEPHGYKLQDTVPYWEFDGMQLCYWDVHFVGVRSINLYANGRISEDYSITKGHTVGGVVKEQHNFDGHKRRNAQWLKNA